MELNREQIIKALECFHQRILKTKLAEKITETEVMALINALSLIKELTEDNERLMREKTALECVVATARNQAKADTVREMQERLKAEKFTHKNFGELVSVWDIDQIAKEMIGGQR